MEARAFQRRNCRRRCMGKRNGRYQGSLFCFLQAVEELIAKDYVPACDVYLASSCTEEIGGEGAPLTVKWLQDNGVHLKFLMDEGGMIKEEP